MARTGSQNLLTLSWTGEETPMQADTEKISLPEMTLRNAAKPLFIIPIPDLSA